MVDAQSPPFKVTGWLFTSREVIGLSNAATFVLVEAFAGVATLDICRMALDKTTVGTRSFKAGTARLAESFCQIRFEKFALRPSCACKVAT